MRFITLAVSVIAIISVMVPNFPKIRDQVLKATGATSETSEEHSNLDQESGEHHESEGHHPQHKVIVTSPVIKDVVLTKRYVSRIHSCRHIEVRALESGYLQSINIREGQEVKEGDILFNILPTLLLAKRDADVAEQELAQIEYDNTKKLLEKNIVAEPELKLAKARLEKAIAQVKLAQAEVNFTELKAPFNGIVDRLHEQQGSLIDEGAMLTTLSDNSHMWVYFNVPEKGYLEYQQTLINDPSQSELNVQLELANHQLFAYEGGIGAIEADFDNETGNIAFRADFPNPDRLLRHGQTGTVLINRTEHDATVIPQRATFEILAKKYVYVVDGENVVHQREIVVQSELEDIFVLESGVAEDEKIVLEGIRQVRAGEKVEFEYLDPHEVLSNLKYPAQ